MSSEPINFSQTSISQSFRNKVGVKCINKLPNSVKLVNNEICFKIPNICWSQMHFIL